MKASISTTWSRKEWSDGTRAQRQAFPYDPYDLRGTAMSEADTKALIGRYLDSRLRARAAPAEISRSEMIAIKATARPATRPRPGSALVSAI